MSLEQFPSWVWQALFTVAMTWGAIRAELRYLRRDVDKATERLDALTCQGLGRRGYDHCHQPGGKPL